MVLYCTRAAAHSPFVPGTGTNEAIGNVAVPPPETVNALSELVRATTTT